MEQNKQSIFSLLESQKDSLIKRHFSLKRNIRWNVHTVRKNEHLLDWSLFSENVALPADKKFLFAFADKWDWHKLTNAFYNMENQDDFAEIISKYRDKIDWKLICRGQNISPNLVEIYAEYIDWDSLSGNNLFAWTMEFIHKYKHKIDWEALAKNIGEPSFVNSDKPDFDPKNSSERNQFIINLLQTYYYRWNWTKLSGNSFMVFDAEILEAFKEDWRWDILIHNRAVKWTLNLAEQYHERLPALSAEQFETTHLWECLIIEAFKLEFKDDPAMIENCIIQNIINLL
ncbi:MAG: hypothetical protein PHU27_12240 [Salinivirgaceae bacterium]|nr:hypothetical protein [Salinivirgaceae bacterium]